HFVDARDAMEPETPEGVLESSHRSRFDHEQIPNPTGDLLLLRDALFHPRGLALKIPQEIQLRAPHARRSHDVDLGDRRRVQRKDALDALTERDLAHREAGPRAAAVHADDDAFEDLDSFLVALADLHVHADGIAGLHSRSIRQL